MGYSEILDSECKKLSLNPPVEQREKLAAYCTELERWNQKTNLTSLSGVELVRRLVVEPVWIGAELGISGVLADIGSGNGAPAIPLASTRSLIEAHLVESRLKRAAFLRHLKAKLELTNVSVHHNRFEDIASELKPLDWITLQAVALSPSMLALLREAATPTTKVVWITARAESPVPSSTMLRVPGSETVAWVFSVDHS